MRVNAQIHKRNVGQCRRVMSEMATLFRLRSMGSICYASQIRRSINVPSIYPCRGYSLRTSRSSSLTTGAFSTKKKVWPCASVKRPSTQPGWESSTQREIEIRMPTVRGWVIGFSCVNCSARANQIRHFVIDAFTPLRVTRWFPCFGARSTTSRKSFISTVVRSLSENRKLLFAPTTHGCHDQFALGCSFRCAQMHGWSPPDLLLSGIMIATSVRISEHVPFS